MKKTFKSLINEDFEKILNSLIKFNIKPIFVGGCVRDFFLKSKSKDFDIELYNIEKIELLEDILKDYGKCLLVGKSFGVLKFISNNKDLEIDFSLPRVEKKTGVFHTSYEVILNSKMSFKKASLRRDFTINSIGYDYKNSQFLDPNFGIKDLKSKKIRYINKKTFVEDSLRVYRAVGFASRFAFKIEDKTLKLCKKIVKNGELKFLAKERVFEEFKKIFLKSKKPSIALKYLEKLNILKTQNKKSFDNLANILKNRKFDDIRKLKLFFSLLVKNSENKGKEEFINSFTDDKSFIKDVLFLSSLEFYKDEIFLKRLSFKTILEDYFIFYEALGIDKKFLKEARLIAIQNNILNNSLEVFIGGKDLLNLGLKPSRKFKEYLDFCLNLQIENNLTKDEILAKLKDELIRINNN